MATITSTIKLVDQMTPTLNKISKAIDRVNGQSRAMGNVKTWNGFNAGARTATKSTHSLYNAIRRTVFVLGTLRGLQGFANVADTMMNANARINNITNDLAKTKYYMDAIYLSAQRSRSAFMTTANSVGKLATLAGSAFDGSMEQVIAFTELMNKMFVISGASAAEASNAMYQLTQAMAAGKLQGDEMRSILENAPMLAQKLADKLGVSVGEIKDLGAEGKITADIIKDALFASAEEIEEKFKNMPKTIGQTWTEISNYALNAFRPVIDRVQQFINSPIFDKFKNKLFAIITAVANGIIRLFDLFETPRIQNAIAKICNAFSVLWEIASWVGNAMVQLAIWISENWGWIAPIIYTIAWAFLVYKAAIAIATVAMWAYNAAQFVAGIIAGTIVLTTFGWVVLIIVAIIAVLYLAVAAWNHFTGQTVSATGIIFGAVAFVITCVIDLFVFLWDCFMSLIHILIALGKTIWQVCVDVFQFIIALATNIVMFVVMVIASALWIVLSIGTNIISTLGWVIDAFKVWGSNIMIGMSQLCDNLPIYWEIFKLAVIQKFWSIVTNGANAFNSLLRGAHDLCEKMIQPFVDLTNGVIRLLNKIGSAWNELCSNLTMTVDDNWITQKLGLAGAEIGLSGLKVNEIKEVSNPLTGTAWTGINTNGMLQALASSTTALQAAKGKLTDVNWSTNALPDYEVDWGATWDGLKGMWSNIQWADLGTFDGSKYSDIWGDLKGSLGDTWDSSQYKNPIDAFKNWYDKGETLENGITGLIEGIGGLLSGLFGGGGSGSGNVGGPLGELNRGQGIGGSGDLPSSLEDLLGGYGGSGGGLGDALGAIKDNTGSSAGSAGNIEDTLDLAEEELELLRKIAEQEVINRFTTAEIKVDMTNNNNISSKMDLDGIVTHLSNKLYEELGVVASGVHY